MAVRDHRYDVASSMIDKLRLFASNLDAEERAALHMLLLPGVASAFEERQVSGHSATTWSPGAIPEWLVAAMIDQGLQLQGLE